MGTKKEVRLIWDNNAQSFETRINKHVSNGWKPKYCSFKVDGSTTHFNFFILMEKNVKKEAETERFKY